MKNSEWIRPTLSRPLRRRPLMQQRKPSRPPRTVRNRASWLGGCHQLKEQNVCAYRCILCILYVLSTRACNIHINCHTFIFYIKYIQIQYNICNYVVFQYFHVTVFVGRSWLAKLKTWHRLRAMLLRREQQGSCRSEKLRRPEPNSAG